MAFDDLTNSLRREIINLVKASDTGTYSPELQVEHIPANQLEHSRINIRIMGLDGAQGPLIEFYDVNDFYTIAAVGYIEATTSAGDKVRLTQKAFLQYRLLTELPNRDTSPSDTIKYWLEDFKHVEEALERQEWDITERRFNKWKERASRSLADNLIGEMSAELLRFALPAKRNGRITRPFERIEKIAWTIASCRRLLEEVLVEINKYGEDAYRKVAAYLPLEVSSSASPATETAQFNSLTVDSSQEPVEADANGLYANKLYETAKRLINNSEALDDKAARMIVETCDDAIKEFGNTNQDKKVELRTWKARAEEVLPPKTIKELTERAEGYVLGKGYPRQRLWRNLLLSLVGIVAIVGVFAAIYKAIPERTPRQLADKSNKPPPSSAGAGAEIIELALSRDLHMWEDLSDQMDVISDDLQRLEKFDPDKPGSFHFQSNHYKDRDPVIVDSHGNASHPSVDFLRQAKRFFECETRFDHRSRPIARDPLVLNVGIRNNTDRQMTVTKAVLRLVKAELEKTSGDGIIELSPEKHLRPATMIEFKWPISPNELFNALEGTLDTPREDLAIFRNPLIIGPKAIERISLKIDVPLMPIIGRHDALIQFVFTTSEGEVVSQQIYLSSEEL